MWWRLCASTVHDRLTYWTVHLNNFHLIPSSTRDPATYLYTGTETSRRRTELKPWTNLCEPYCFAIVDSGTTYSYAPPQLFEMIMDHITAGLDCFVDADATLLCKDSKYTEFPMLSFSFGLDGPDGNYFRLEPESYVHCEDSLCEVQLRNHAYVVHIA